MHTAAVLALLLPTPEETELLRACLWSGEPARAAWTRWLQAVGDARRAIADETHAAKALLPVLHAAVRRNDLAVDPRLRSTLAAAALSGQLRSNAYHRVCVRALDALAGASVHALLLKGAALADTVYAAPALRHSHDIDVLVGAGDLSHAAQALRHAGFTPDPASSSALQGDRRLTDVSGLPLVLHRGLYRLPFYAPPLADVWSRARRCEIAGQMVATVSAADHLVHVCGQAACGGSRHTLTWVCDAWFLIARDEALDWDVVCDVAHASRLELPLAVMLDYLAERLEAPVPDRVRARLCAAAAHADRVTREMALVGVRAGERGTFRNLFRTAPSWRDRLALARWMLLPAPTTLRRGEPLHQPRLWPAYYVIRPLAYIARRMNLGRWRTPITRARGR